MNYVTFFWNYVTLFYLVALIFVRNHHLSKKNGQKSN